MAGEGYTFRDPTDPSDIHSELAPTEYLEALARTDPELAHRLETEASLVELEIEDEN